MPDSTRRGSLSLEFSVRNADISSSRTEQDQFPILVLGDFRGQAGLLPQSGKNADCIRVDYDNFDSVLARLGPIADLGTDEGTPLKIRFQSLDDFHPDKLLKDFEPLSRLVELRKQLLDPVTASAVGPKIQELLRLSHTSSEEPKTILPQSADDILNRLLGKAVSDRSYRSSSGAKVDHLIKQILGSPSDAIPSEDQNALRTALEKELSRRLRDTLHHPAFQTLEATWRGMDFLVRNVGEDTILRVADIPKSALSALLANGDTSDAPMAGLLAACRPALILGIYTFAPEEHLTLSGLARICAAHQTAFVAGADPELAGWTSFHSRTGRLSEASLPENDEFASLRSKPEANHLGLVLPRFLLRQAYGTRSDPIDTFPFEEIDAAPDHESHLWGNSAFLCGYLMSQSFGESGWDFNEGQGGEISGLPIQQVVIDGEIDTKPCAEAWLSETAGEAIQSRGIIPVLSIRGRDAVRVSSLHSISNPQRNLALRRS
jgi:type VI secretion system protein ImpC